ncbi:dr1-associated corepressor isoform X5 [Tachysurus fulvidraco]|uniref:dr1-associated corepressor isoform X5 n=1 Tax=Tachysurus fulvidraco TaxID=1234273 RepID=UPI000F4DFEF8|nr:dr1-associated corepressor isoform X5 [Tachysurus fulvidraco]
MPGQKRKYNVRFPPQGRIKKIMQKDTEVGRIATAVPVIISKAKALEMFLISLLTKTSLIIQSKNSRVMSINHMKQCIESEKLFDFLKELADQASGSSAAKESKAKGKCLGHRSGTTCPSKPSHQRRKSFPRGITLSLQTPLVSLSLSSA